MAREKSGRESGVAGVRRFVVYGLVDPRDGQIHYVGRTTEGSNRPMVHWTPGLRWKVVGKARQAWIDDLRDSGRGPYEVRILQVVESVEAVVRAEEAWIAFGFRRGWPLANSNRHGRGNLPREARVAQ